MNRKDTLPDFLIEPVVSTALAEDLGRSGDVTSRLALPDSRNISARLVAREGGIVSGTHAAALAFRLVDPALQIDILLGDGCACVAGETVMIITGTDVSILSAERVALNFCGRLMGIATVTAEYVARVAPTKARINCTRKTTPGLRALEKMAVVHGGGFNHRFGLDDAILIKDNHIAIAGGVKPVLEAVRKNASHMMAVQIEVDRIDQLEEVLATGGVNAVLLDNMSPGELRRAVKLIDGRFVTEASGGIDLETVAEVASTGVDHISIGALTHSVAALDVALDI